MGTNKSTKQKRLDRFIQKQLIKDSRAELFAKLSETNFNSDKLLSSKRLGQKITNKEKRNDLPSFLKEVPKTTSNTPAESIKALPEPTTNNETSELFKQLTESDVFQAVTTESTPKKKKNKKRKKPAKPDVHKDNSDNTDNSKLNKKSKNDIENPIVNSTKKNNSTLAELKSASLDSQNEIAQAPIIQRRKRVKSKRVLDKIGWEKKQTFNDSDLENYFSDSQSDNEFDRSKIAENVINDDNLNSNSYGNTDYVTSNVVTAQTMTSNNYDDFSSSTIPKEIKIEKIPKASKNENSSQSENKVFTGSKLKIHLEKQGKVFDSSSNSKIIKPKYINVVRKPGVEELRAKLPIIAEEQPIMEAIKENLVILLCGSTGSGKTTQLPQFLYEAGYAGLTPNSNHTSPNHSSDIDDEPGIIGITQPRRVAAVSMAKRVAYELNTDFEEDSTEGKNSSIVSYQVRFDNKSSKSTKIKFMTDGVLLREMCEDFLLSKYSVIILDEAHERSLNTDILVGTISRIIKLRQTMFQNKEYVTVKNDLNNNVVSNKLVKPLKLVIMSATLMIDEFSKNLRLFNPTPKVIKVESRQFPVCIRFNRFTPVGEAAYVNAAIKKTLQIHEKLPDGGILVFLTGQAEINYFCSEIMAQFNQKLSDIDYKESKKLALSKFRNKNKSTKSDTVNAEQGAVEIEDLEIGDTVDFDSLSKEKPQKKSSKRDTNYEELLVPNHVDDYIDTEDEDDQDGEEEDVWIFNNDENSEEIKKNLVESEKKSDSLQKIHVLPLYATLDPAQQLKVFSNPPPNHRLIIVSTNVAETSITIPNIKYVVDSGKIKDKKYDIQSGTIKYEVDWTSQASADQRAGRSGRTGIGYCYRLYSSNVFTQFFPKFNQPEISKLPIEQVVLLMKFNYINNIESFPFVTPPKKDSITKATRLLEHLGAIDPNNGPITDLGKCMMLFPVSPRYAKMLILGNKHDMLLYVISIISSLTIGNPFKNELDIDKLASDQKNNASDALNDPLTGEDLSIKKKFYMTMNTLAKQNPTSDILKWLSVFGAYEYVDTPYQKSKICTDFFLREKLMSDCHKLYYQLFNICKQQLPVSKKVLSASISKISPPTPQQTTILRQVICNGFVDQIAIRADLANPNNNNTDTNGDDEVDSLVPYITMGSSEKAYIHPSSVLLINKPVGKGGKSKKSSLYHHYPKYLVYGELQKTTKLWMRQITEINPNWLPLLAKTFVTFGKPLQQPVPIYSEDKTTMTCFVSATFGPKSWPLPNVKVEQKRVGTRWVLSKVLN
ncbi:putative ATP-dependent RNA helicase [Smittium culicis]|uniref:RNA helicase n=1 Tax=Smittium culicis TaxID=133412 RepID=A0A1R1XZ53_9FUNG|nr:putative ATP-dependent RNA helicase [Smittium culicis]